RIRPPVNFGTRGGMGAVLVLAARHRGLSGRRTDGRFPALIPTVISHITVAIINNSSDTNYENPSHTSPRCVAKRRETLLG
ncbi:hypothetical protein ACLOJK_007107, partial [Asimina triloba]